MPKKQDKNDLILQSKRSSLSESFNRMDRYLFEGSREPSSVTDQLDLLNLDQLSEGLRNGGLRPTDVLTAFQNRAHQLNQNDPAGVCEFIHEAHDMARKLESRDVPQDQRSPLYGIPISIKEVCSYKGYDVTFNMVKRCNLPSDHTGTLVNALIQEGAIPFVLTQCTQFCMSNAGKSVIFGDLSNPIVENFEPGGSSSGEAVLLAKGGSILGVGTDIGGSIRIPASFCGLVGLKPTSDRLSTQGSEWSMSKNTVALSASIGPMAKRVDYLVAFMRTVLRPSMFAADSSVPPLPFNESLFQQQQQESDHGRLKIAYYNCIDHESIIQSVPAVRNAVNKVVARLANEHQLVPFQPPQIKKASELLYKCFFADGGKTALNLMANEPLDATGTSLRSILKKPGFVKAITSKTPLAKKSKVGKPVSLVAGTTYPVTRNSVLDLIDHVRDYRKTFAELLHDYDALICPVFPVPGIGKEHDVASINPAQIYTALYNLVDYPAGVVPVGKVDQSDLDQAGQDASRLERMNDKFNASIMHMQSNTMGLPLSVQVVGKPYQEELVLRLMKQIESEFGGSQASNNNEGNG